MSRFPTWCRSAVHWSKSASQSGRFNLSLLVGDLALAGWLALAQAVYLPGRPVSAAGIAVPALVVAAIVWVWRGHDLRGGWPWRLGLRMAGAALTAGLMLALLRPSGATPATIRECLWLAAAAAGLGWALRVTHLAAQVRWPDQPGEIFRGLVVLGAAGALVWPFWTTDSIGSGDAHWYTMMLADFVTQWRAGVFPVWVGQSEYAFNGAILPLRVAPWFQHWGGVMDLLSAHALGFLALKNVTLTTAALAGALAAYAGLRSILGRRPWLAALLAALWMASPGVLAPLMAGDQYMTFMTLPFVVAALYGIWRCWDRDDRRARVAIAAGLAGLLLSHTPIALWMGLLAGANYAAKIIVRRTWSVELRRVAAMAATFFVLGGFPLLSVLALDNLNPGRASGVSAFPEIAGAFPFNFLPIDLHRNALTAYQLGYTGIGAFALTVLLLSAVRPRGATALTVSAVLIAPFTVPVPWLTRAIWNHLPDWFVTINNIWPMQRLFLIWTAMIFFGLAVVVASDRVSGRRRLVAGLWVALLGGAVWSWHEARMLAAIIEPTRSPAGHMLLLQPDDLLLTRYAYASFARTPDYFSSGYMDPYLENRLLARDTLRVVSTNAEAAAPRLEIDDTQVPVDYPRLVQSGVFSAVNDNRSDFYNLSPAITLQPDVSYALRLDFLQAGEHGVLQLMDPRLFREYYLPDSGLQTAAPGKSLAFGSEPQSGRVIPLRVSGPGPAVPRLYFITPRRPATRFPFARFSLFTYRRAQLPVAVESWIPYRARVQTAVPVWLETPRVWQSRWSARVNGRPVAARRSPQGLVMLPVEPGDSQVELDYRPPWWLRLDYWVSLGGWLALGLVGAAGIGRAAGRAVRAA